MPDFDNSQGTAKHEIKYDAAASPSTLPCIFLSFDNSNKIGWLSKSNFRLNEAVKVGRWKGSWNNNSKNIVIDYDDPRKIFWPIWFDCVKQWQSTEAIRNHIQY